MPPTSDRGRHHGVEPLRVVIAEAIRQKGKYFLKYDEEPKAQQAKTLPNKLVAAKDLLDALRGLSDQWDFV